MPRMTSPSTWDADGYDASFAFVSDHGESLVRLLEPTDGERVLDLGCGTGRLTAAIAATGADAVGLDGDPAMVERAREQFPGLRFELADAQRLAEDPQRWGGTFDAVFSNAALHWMTEPEAVLRGVAALLRPGGRFVAELGAAGNIATVETALRDALDEAGVPREAQPAPWYFPTPAGYAALLERHGLELRALWHFARPTPLEGGAEGLARWLHMFGATFFEGLTPERIEQVARRVEDATRAELWRDGQWVADYRRLRFWAERTER